jgi:hypothetical protein
VVQANIHHSYRNAIAAVTAFAYYRYGAWQNKNWIDGMRNRLRVGGSTFARLVAAAAIMVAAAPAVSATAEANNKRVQRACLADYKNLCPQYRTSSPQLRACMESKANEISWGCIEALIDSGEVDRKRVTRR